MPEGSLRAAFFFCARACPMQNSGSMTDRKPLPAGVVIRPLAPHADARGSLTEFYRESWKLGCKAAQWNLVISEANVLRGMHVHVRHNDHLVLIKGAMHLALYDMRPWSPTAKSGHVLTLSEEAPCAVAVPIGVAHAFYFPVPAILAYGSSREWDEGEDMGCRWDDPELGLAWRVNEPTVSRRDAAAGSLADLAVRMRERWMAAHGHFGPETVG